MKNQPTNFSSRNSFELEPTPERGVEAKSEKEPGSENSEEKFSEMRQRSALVEIQSKSFLNALYGSETEDEILKEHFDIHYFGEYPEDTKSTFKIRQEYDLQIICGFTNSNFPQQKIGMYVYPTLKAKQEADPNHSISRASFRSQEYRIYRVWGEEMEQISFPHEITHAVAHLWAMPYLYKTVVDTHDNQKIQIEIPMVSTSFFQEGLAIAVDELAFGYKLKEGEEKNWPDDFIKNAMDNSVELPSISSLVLIDGFDKYDTKLVVPMAASFSKFLIMKYGIQSFKQLYISLTEYMNKDAIDAKVTELLHDSFNNLELLWKQSLLDTNK